jgi:NhaA family Na+:H+ antiporter
VLPIFAFANAGISFTNMSAGHVFHSIPMGIALGLILGKQAGVFGLCWLVIKLKLTYLPSGMSWKSLYGVAALCGVGFTMSLFIGSLAFEETGANLLFDERLGIILGSLVSAVLGYLVLRATLPAGREFDSKPKSIS